jgi:hypothetical protein
MGQYQARLCAPRQTKLYPIASLGMLRLSGFDQKRYRALLSLPLAHVVAHISVRQAGLTENSMLKGEAAFIAFLWLRYQPLVDTTKGVHLLCRFHGGKVAQKIT